MSGSGYDAVVDVDDEVCDSSSNLRLRQAQALCEGDPPMILLPLLIRSKAIGLQIS